MPPLRILVIKLADIGDVLTATPALAALRRRYPAATLELLTTPAAAAVVPADLVDHVLTAPRALVRRGGDVLPLARLLRALRAARYDTVLVLHHLTLGVGAAKYRLLAAVTGAAVVAGLDNGKGGWLTHRVADLGFGAQHEVRYWLQVAALLDAHADGPEQWAMQAAVAAEDSAAAARLLPPTDGPRVLIHPGSGGYAPARRWEPAKWAALADALAARYRAQIVLVGGAGDGADEVQRHMAAPVVNLVGQTTLPQVAALLASCDLFLGADSGVMHLAAAVRAPLVALFGPSNSDAWGPWTPLSPSAVVRLGLRCSPCSYVGHGVGARNGCWHRSCLADLQPARVLAAVADLLPEWA